MKKPRTRHVANTCELSGLNWKYRTDAADYINTFKTREFYCWFEILGSESKFLWMRDTWKTREVGREMTRKSKRTIHNTYRSKCEDKQKDRPAQITAQPNRAYEWTSGRSQAPRGLGSNSSFLKNKRSSIKSCKTRIPTKKNSWKRRKMNKSQIRGTRSQERGNIANKHKKFEKASRMKSKRTK